MPKRSFDLASRCFVSAVANSGPVHRAVCPQLAAHWPVWSTSAKDRSLPQFVEPCDRQATDPASAGSRRCECFLRPFHLSALSCRHSNAWCWDHCPRSKARSCCDQASIRSASSVRGQRCGPGFQSWPKRIECDRHSLCQVPSLVEKAVYP